MSRTPTERILLPDEDVVKLSGARVVPDVDGVIFPAIDTRRSDVDFSPNEPRIGIIICDFERRHLPPANDRRPSMCHEQERAGKYD